MADLEAALEGAFSPQPPAPVPENLPPPAPAAAAEPPPEEEPPVAAEGEEAPPEEAQQEEEAQPEWAVDIEIDGKPETIVGTERVKELVARGLKAGRTGEENARVREALAAHVQQAQLNQQFQAAVFQDVSELRALDQQLEQYNKVDWNAAFDTNAFEALKLREQREQLKEARQKKQDELNQKQQQFSAFVKQNEQKVLQAETGALLAKLPEWRNPEKAQTEQRAISSWLANAGFNGNEIDSLTDHRMLLVARKAYLYDQLQAGKANAVKQVRTAPPVVKPGAKPAVTQSGKAEFAKFRSTVKQLGTKGQHKAQEDLVVERLSRAFKT